MDRAQLLAIMAAILRSGRGGAESRKAHELVEEAARILDAAEAAAAPPA